MNDFLKQGFSLRKPLQSTKSFLSNTRTVCVKTKDGKITEHHNITEPWRYIAKVKKQFNVEDAWIKD
jgi:hypothetical protein